MKISVVTISFNQARFLRHCIESVLSQNYKNFEYIIVDPGSTDGSREIIESYGDRISHVIFDADCGPADGLNKGFTMADGDIFYYINSDDVLEPNSFSKVKDFFEKHPEIDVLLGRGKQIDEAGHLVRKLFPSKRWTLEKYALGVANAIQQSTFIRASAFRRTVGFNTANTTCWDGELLVDLSIVGAQFGTSRDSFGQFRVYASSITGSGRLNAAYERDCERIRNRIWSYKGRSSKKAQVFHARLLEYLFDPPRLVDCIVRSLKY